MGIALWPVLGLAALCACTDISHDLGATQSDVPVRPGLWSVVSISGGVADPRSRNEECLAETTWFAMAALSSGSRAMGCEPLERLEAHTRGDPVIGIREVCRQGNRAVVRIVSLEAGRQGAMPLTTFNEVERIYIEGQGGEKMSRTRHIWLGACPGPNGELLGFTPK